MEEEKLSIKAKRKKVLSNLTPVLGELGFSRVNYSKDKLVVEKTQGEDLSGKKHLHYRIIFGKNSIEFIYSVPENTSKRSRMLEVFPVFLNAVRMAEEHYEIKPSHLFEPVIELLKEVETVLDKDVVEMSSQMDSSKEKLNYLTKKYEDLVRSSEENARILLECERKRDESQRRIDELQGISDDALKEELFRWLRMHNGNIDLAEFSKSHGNITSKRIEEGLNLLLKEGYIKKRVI